MNITVLRSVRKLEKSTMTPDERFVLVAAVVFEYESCVKARGEGERGVAYAIFQRSRIVCLHGFCQFS